MSFSDGRRPPVMLCAVLLAAGAAAIAWALLEHRLTQQVALFLLFLLCALSVGMLLECRRFINCCTRRLQGLHPGEADHLRREVLALTLEREISLVAASGCDSVEAARRILELLSFGMEIHGGAVFVARKDGDLRPLFARWGRRSGQLERAAAVLPDTLISAASAAYRRAAQNSINIRRKTALLLPFGGEDGARGLLAVVVPESHADTALYLCRQVLRPVSLALRVPALYERAVFDALTGLYSRRHFETELPRIFEEARRTGQPLSLIMTDIDHFKRINDTYGHKTGDEVLAGVARVVRSILRSYDMAFRYGGEEFCIVLQRTDLRTAFKVAERIRKMVSRSVLRSTDGRQVPVTLSCGVAELCGFDAGYTDLVERADGALYEAKRGGRNRTVTATPKPTAKTGA